MGATFLLPTNVLSQLRCDLCHGYLSVAPISTYEEKFSCGRCNPGWPRNVIYEHLAQYMLFPCTYCEEMTPWADVPKHEHRCRHNVVLCSASYEKNYKISRLPMLTFGEYHKECQIRKISCPFDLCTSKYDVRDIFPHFDKFHKNYIFSNNLVTAHKILKEEKVWNFNPDNQVCLLMHKQMPFLLFVHSDCHFEESTGDILSYDYFFSVFSPCLRPCDMRYVVTLTMDSDESTSNLTMKNQDVKPFNEKLHSVNYLRNGLIKYDSFNFMTTRFEKLKKAERLKLVYTVKLLDSFEAAAAETPATEKASVSFESLRKNLECPICKEYMCAPVYNCALGHSVCKACKAKMTACPFCKAGIGTSRNFVFEDILDALQVCCQNESKGCKFVGRVQEIKGHELTCLFNS